MPIRAPTCLTEVYQTLPLKRFIWLTVALSQSHAHPFKEDHQVLPLSTPLSSRWSVVWCPQVVPQAPQHFRSSEMQATCDGCFAQQSLRSFSFILACPGQCIHLWTLLWSFWKLKKGCKLKVKLFSKIQHNSHQHSNSNMMHFINTTHYQGDSPFNPFTAMLAALSLWKRPIKVANLKYDPPMHEHRKGFLSKCTILNVYLLLDYCL